MNRDEALLDVENLQISTTTHEPTALVKGVSFTVNRGEFVGVVGESGSGKTLTSLAISRLLPHGLTSSAGHIMFDGHDLSREKDDQLRSFLGTSLAMIFQDPMSSLNPARRVGAQMVEAVREHEGKSRSEALDLAVKALDDVHVSDPSRRLKQYPHELSGGMRQRVMIAMGLMSEPSLIVADEPTTALDVTVQAQVMKLLVELNERRGTAVLLITHNIALLSEVCDRIVVMYRGRVVEVLSNHELLTAPRHPYTRALIAAVPDINADRSRELVTVGDQDFDRTAETHDA